MELRDAIEADSGRLATLTDSPQDVMRNLVHDRTVRVAEDGEEIVGFVSYDAREQTVHVTQIEAEGDIYEPLLEEPLRFASNEDMTVELLVLQSESEIQTIAAEMGFDEVGTGPRFEGEPTRRYQISNP